jgi:hypothetical protein
MTFLTAVSAFGAMPGAAGIGAANAAIAGWVTNSFMTGQTIVCDGGIRLS